MVDARLFDMVCCPESRQPLGQADSELVAQLNEGIRRGTIKNRRGDVVTEPLDEGLVRRDGKVLYPVRGSVPMLLQKEGIEVGQEDTTRSP